MNILSYVKKALALLQFKFIYNKNFIYPFFYLFKINKDKLTSCRRILFYFNNAEFMHIGDQLFFIKTIKILMNNAYRVDVIATKVMQNVLRKIGINVVDGNKVTEHLVGQYDLVVSRFELYASIRNNPYLKQLPLLLVNITKNITMPIADDLAINFSALFQLNPIQTVDYGLQAMSDLHVLQKFALKQEVNYYIVCPYCDSNFFLVTSEKTNTILSYATMTAQQKNSQLILVGTIQDKLKDKHNQEYANLIDLRGKTTVDDICYLANLHNVLGFIGFDNFIMHVFSILHKPSFVVYRGRLTKKRSAVIKDSHINLHNGEHFVTLI